jgi:uncharacterized membrane-anchored protein
MTTEDIYKNIELRTFYRFLMVLSIMIIIIGVSLGFEDVNFVYSVITTILGSFSLTFVLKLYFKVPYSEKY